MDYQVFFVEKLKKKSKRQTKIDYPTVIKNLSLLCKKINNNEEMSNLTEAHVSKVLSDTSALMKKICSQIGYRVICAPSEELKIRQKQVQLTLETISVHSAAFGFVKNRGAIDCAKSHLIYWGKDNLNLMILNADVSNFFHSVSRDLVTSTLRRETKEGTDIEEMVNTCMASYSKEFCLHVVDNFFAYLISKWNDTNETRLTKLKSEIVDLFNSIQNSDDSLEGSSLHRKFCITIFKEILGIGLSLDLDKCWFLPQGSPASPVITNLIFKSIDKRLKALSESYEAHYTRYADDLTFSWLSPVSEVAVDEVKRCSNLIISEIGMSYNKDKIIKSGPGYKQEIVGFTVGLGEVSVSKRLRRNTRSLLQSEFENVSPTHTRVIDRLTGLAGYIGICHTNEKEWLMDSIRRLSSKNARKIRD